MRSLHILFWLLSLQAALFSQVAGEKLQLVEQHFRAQEYSSVLSISDSLLRGSTSLSNSELLRLYEIRGMVFYAADDLQSSLFSFIAILDIHSEHQLDPVRTSPKIRSYFEEIRADFLNKKRIAAQNRDKRQQEIDSLEVAIQQRSFAHIRGSMIRSVLVPGWGHLHNGETRRGWLLTALSMSTIGMGTYYTLEAQSRENDYLNETNPDLFSGRFDAFNKTYQIRNGVYIAFAALWIYSQVDLFYFSRKPGISSSKTLSYFPVPVVDRENTLRLLWQMNW
ncbi:MAG: hypothetical protein ACRBF0_06235 [Calditrichia bacterium]